MAGHRPIWAIALLVGIGALVLPTLVHASWVAPTAAVVAFVAALAMIADLVRRALKTLLIGALAAILLLGCAIYLLVAGRGGGDELEASLASEGFTDIRLTPIGDGVLALEARRDGDVCTGEIRSRAPMRRAIQCTSAEPLAELEHDCDAGELERCADLAARIRSVAPIDWPRATRASERACEGGLGRECLYVGMARELGGRGVPQDRSAAARDYERACSAGAQSACARRAQLEP